jgi:hypothetical protein
MGKRKNKSKNVQKPSVVDTNVTHDSNTDEKNVVDSAPPSPSTVAAKMKKTVNTSFVDDAECESSAGNTFEANKVYEL